ncbi:MAG: isocitrate/isopropylmalate family dehydrogenase, partial [Alphaproteobacteria bacterium]|nr:isocitrate/isopropylmalate family dehydrogenase [Alphaproteobacteria bacterium]
CATILTVAMMLRHLGEDASADMVETSVHAVLAEAAVRTSDLGGTATSAEMTDAVLAALSRS